MGFSAMQSIFRSTVLLLAVILLAPTTQATLIQAGWFFDGNNDNDMSSISQTVTAANGNITFDIDVTISSISGTVVDTSNIAGPVNQQAGLGIGAGNNVTAGQTVTFAVSLSNIVQNGPHRISLQDLTFRFLGIEAGNGIASEGTLVTPAGSSGTSWQDANSASNFNGHLPLVTTYGTGLTDAFFVNTSTGLQSTGNFDTQSGFDIPRSNITNGAPYASRFVTTFSHTTDANQFRLNDLVVEVRATPEPSSIVLGLVALGFGGVVWRRRKKSAETAAVA
jgi:hypothetical protein